MFQEGIVEIFTTQVCISSSCLYSEYTTADVKKRNIESSSSQVEDQNVLFGLGLTVETVRNSSSGRLVDNPKDIKTSNGTSIFSGKTLRVIEVSRYPRNGELLSKNSGYEKKSHVTTAFLTVFPSFASEISLILERTMAEIS